MKTFKLLSLALFAIVAGLVSCTDYQDEIKNEVYAEGLAKAPAFINPSTTRLFTSLPSILLRKFLPHDVPW